jgi:hypothetical protein
MADKDTSNRAFGAMDEDREIASKGGHALDERDPLTKKAWSTSSPSRKRARLVIWEDNTRIGNRPDGAEGKGGLHGSGTRRGTSEQHAQPGRQTRKTRG